MLKKLPLMALTALSIIPFQAHAGNSNDIYVSVTGGWANGLDPDLDSNNGVTPSTSADNGYVAGAAIGKHYGNWRAEAELAYREVDLDVTLTDGTTTETGSTDSSALSVMVNGYYDFDIGQSHFKPYVGLGLGIADVQADGFSTNSFIATDGEETEAAYQAMLGVNYQLTDKTAIGTGYRFFNTFSDDSFGGTHEALASVKFGF